MQPTVIADTFFFDPVANLFSTAPHMTVPRVGHTLTTLGSGRALAAGGEAQGSTEIYDPVKSSWTPSAPLTTPRFAHTATLLENGKVLLVSGRDGSNYLASAEVYKP